MLTEDAALGFLKGEAPRARASGYSFRWEGRRMPCFARELRDGRTALPGGARGVPVPCHSLFNLGSRTVWLPPRRGAGSRGRAGWVSRCREGRRSSRCVVGGHFCLYIALGGTTREVGRQVQGQNCVLCFGELGGTFGTFPSCSCPRFK